MPLAGKVFTVTVGNENFASDADQENRRKSEKLKMIILHPSPLQLVEWRSLARRPRSHWASRGYSLPHIFANIG